MAKLDNSKRTEEALSPKEVEELKEKLLAERERIVALYSQDLRAGQEAKGEDSDDLVDRANQAYNRELLFSLSDTERRQLIQIDEALQRIEEGTYGICMHSGKPIARARLDAVPWARYSIEYQELAEKGLLEEGSA